ncbi:MAG: hypothetical protein IPP71_14270 [Bacteroidetes bacterium]|nr:hypothetical protein [Bacteroidota bacterium]
MQEIAFLKIRLAQSFRELKALGFLYALILCGGSCLLLVAFYSSQYSMNNTLYALLGLSFVIFSIHRNRIDHNFIQLVAERPYLIFCIEYAVAVLPFIVLSAMKSNSALLVLIFVPVAVISLIKKGVDTNVSFNVIGNHVHSELYEWKSGLRRSGGVVVLLWVLAILLLGIPFASLILLWFVLLILSSFYDQGESRDMILSFKLNEKNFLFRKLRLHTSIYFLFMAPVLVLNSFIFSDKWWVFVLFGIFSCVNLMVFIVSKYAVWRHGENNSSNSILNTICMVGFFLPFLLPLPLFILIKNYRKAVNNLHPLLNDFHK